MCEDFAGKMYCRCCGETFYFDRQSHKPNCPHVREEELEDLKRRVSQLEEEKAEGRS